MRSTVLHQEICLIIQKCMYKQKEITLKHVLYNCFYSKQIEKPNIFFPLKTGFLKNSFVISFDIAYFTFNIYNLYIMLKVF